ncbi:MAG: anti-sigma factor [Taibaiella sp.]|nr:anti-sigma factor [Taibaiella sp.]
MNTAEYIASGILEAYVMGVLPPEEMREVAANVAQYPELAAEVASIEATMLSLSSQPLPAGLDDKIWAAIESSNNSAGITPGEAPTPTGRTINFQPEYRKPRQWQIAAAVAALAASAALNVYLWQQGDKQSAERATLAARMDSLAEQQKQLALQVDKYRKAKEMMADTAMQTIVMHTVVKGHPMAATVYWSKEKSEAYVSVDGLPAPPPGMQYQLWVLMDGKPVDMGVLPIDMANTPSIMKVSKPVTGGQAFAISLEKAGGSPTPTMENIYVMGKA